MIFKNLVILLNISPLFGMDLFSIIYLVYFCLSLLVEALLTSREPEGFGEGMSQLLAGSSGVGEAGRKPGGGLS